MTTACNYPQNAYSAALFAILAGGFYARRRNRGAEGAVAQFLNACHIIVAIGMDVNAAGGDGPGAFSLILFAYLPPARYELADPLSQQIFLPERSAAVTGAASAAE